MKQRTPSVEGGREQADLHYVRLMALLRQLVRDHGRRRAAAILGVDPRTLDAGLDERVLSRRMRGALDRALRTGVGSAAPSERDHDDELEGRLKDIRGPGRGAGAAREQGVRCGPGRRAVARGMISRRCGAPGGDAGGRRSRWGPAGRARRCAAQAQAQGEAGVSRPGDP